MAACSAETISIENSAAHLGEVREETLADSAHVALADHGNFHANVDVGGGKRIGADEHDPIHIIRFQLLCDNTAADNNPLCTAAPR